MKLLLTLDDLYDHKNNWPQSLITDISTVYQSVENVAKMLMGLTPYDESLFTESYRSFQVADTRKISRLVCDAIAGEPILFALIEEMREVERQRRLSSKDTAESFNGLAPDRTRLKRLDAESQSVRDYARQFLNEKHESEDTVEGVLVALQWVLEAVGELDESDFKHRHHSIAFASLGSELIPWIRERKRLNDGWANDIDLDLMPNKIFTQLIQNYPHDDLEPVADESYKAYAVRVTKILIGIVEGKSAASSQQANENELKAFVSKYKKGQFVLSSFLYNDANSECSWNEVAEEACETAEHLGFKAPEIPEKQISESRAKRIIGGLVRKVEQKIATEAEEETNVGRAKAKPKKNTANDLMKAEMAANLEEVKGLTAKAWGLRIGKSKSTIVETETWKSLSLLRQQVKAERMEDRRRKPKHNRTN